MRNFLHFFLTILFKYIKPVRWLFNIYKYKLMNQLNYITIQNFSSEKGTEPQDIQLSYQLFGKKLHTAPIVLINHALTGNSDVAGEKGWWKEIVGQNCLIDTNNFTVIAFNVLGNGYDGTLIENYKDFIAKDIANIFNIVLDELGVKNIFALIGGSLGGGIAWEMAFLKPKFIKYLIPIASDWKASDWIIAHNSIQESILLHSEKPLQDARKMAMLFYRTPTSLSKKFRREKIGNKQQFQVSSWLNHHGKKLAQRFELKAYLMLNHLLTTIGIEIDEAAFEELMKPVQATIIQISVNSDLFFLKSENLKTKEKLDILNVKNQYHEIQSEDGHDAFLIEHQQISSFLSPIFQLFKQQNKVESYQV